MGAFKNLFKPNHSTRDSSISSSSPSPSSPSSSSYSNTSPNPTAAYHAPPSSRPAWTPTTESSSSQPSSSGFGPRNLGESRPWSYYASALSSSNSAQAAPLQTRAYPPVVASASTPDLAAIGNMMCQQMSTVRLDSERDMYWSYHTPPALAMPPRTSTRPLLPRPPSSSTTPATLASTSALPQSVRVVPGRIQPSPRRDPFDNSTSKPYFPSRHSQHSSHPSTPTGPSPNSPRNFHPPASPTRAPNTTSAPPRPTSTLYPQAFPLDPKLNLPSPPRGPDPFRQTVPPSPQLPAGLPDRERAGVGLGRPTSMQPFHWGAHEGSRNITLQLPGAFPKSAAIDATTSPPASSAGIKPKWLPNKSIETPTKKVVLPSSNPGRENVTPTETPSSAQRHSGAPKLCTPTSSSPSKARVQCSGTTTSNKRCMRMVESSCGDPSSPGPLHNLHLASYCHQHLKTSLSEPGCFVLSNVRGGEHWVEYEDWILSDLDERTKVLLRSEMASRVSSLDAEGYLYIHEFPPSSTSTSTTYLKIGRSVKPLSRLSQWKNQCPSRKPIVRDILPRTNTTTSSGTGLGTMHFAERGTPNHHRWERLVLIEVSGRAKMMAMSTKPGGKKEGGMGKQCGDCGQRHVEMFEVGKGAYDLWVRDVLERWERWCRDVIG